MEVLERSLKIFEDLHEDLEGERSSRTLHLSSNTLQRSLRILQRSLSLKVLAKIIKDPCAGSCAGPLNGFARSNAQCNKPAADFTHAMLLLLLLCPQAIAKDRTRFYFSVYVTLSSILVPPVSHWIFVETKFSRNLACRIIAFTDVYCFVTDGNEGRMPTDP